MGGNAAGYTGSSINLRNALTAEGVEFTEKARVVLHYCHPADCFPISGKTNLLWSMYEGEPLPPIFAAKFARVHAVIAPSQFVYDLFKPHVGKKPLVVSHIGFDDSLYTYKERSWEPGKGQFEFLWVGAPNPRKGWPATFSSWAHLFQDKEWAHLTMKTSSETGKGTLRHFGNATFDSRLYTREEMRDLYHQANAFVFPTAGEGFGLCVSFSTLITTESGTIPMSDVLVGHRVLTGDGTYSDVVDKLTRTSWTRRVSVQGAPELTITPEHPFLSVKRNGARKLKLIDCSNPNWLRADELEKGDLVAFPRLRLSHGIARLDVMNYIDSQRFESNDEHVWSKWGYSSKTQCSLLKIQKKYRCSKRIAEDAVNICRGNLGAQGRNLKTTGTVAARLSVCLIQNGDVSYSAPVLMKRYVDIDDDFMLLVGWYLAEGSSKRAVEIDCHANEVPGLNQLASIIFDKFGLNSSVSKKGNKFRLVCSSSALSMLMRKLCGYRSYNKMIHKDLISDSVPLGSLLSGLFNGDGHLGKTGWSLCTVSPSLAFQVKFILSYFGINGLVGAQNRRGGLSSRTVFDVAIAGCDAVRFSELTGLLCPLRVGRASKVKHIVTENFIFTPVRSIRDLKEKGEVMDISVRGTHSFVGNGVLLHNTAAEALATGCPVVTTRYGGQMEFLDNGVAWTIDSVFENIPMTNGIGYLRSACADVPDLGRKMIEIIQDYPKALERAKRGSVRMHAKFTMRAAARQLLRNIQLLGYA